ncbi:MAG: methylated-DNA--[protein]-cysteine S-methyltransferase [Acidimicrobiia bacterium]
MSIAEHVTIPSPVGPLHAVIEDGRLVDLSFDDGRTPGKSDDRLGLTAHLRAYFAGDLDALADLDLDMRGTAFQLDVWNALRAIPPGETVSYRDIAEVVGRPDATRAVGNAVGSNPIAIVVPCHRVIRTSGGLGGFGGGLDRKRWLLAHEGARQREPVQSSLVPGR